MKKHHKKVFLCIAMGRSGSHCLAGWILSQLPSNTLFVNDYGARTAPLFERFYSEKVTQTAVWRQECVNIIKLKQLSQDHNIDMNDISDKQIIYAWRDPWNQFASLIAFWKKRTQTDPARWKPKPIKRYTATIRKLYIPNHKLLLNHMLKREEVLPHNSILWQYDKWFDKPEYRRELSNKIGLNSPNSGVNKIWNDSSFDNFKKHSEQADQLRVHDRWKHFVEYKEYRDLFNDKELIELASHFYTPPF